MPYLNRTYRIADGERIEGSWCHVFLKNGVTYFLTDLKVYADRMIDCWGLVDFTTFRQKVASGWVVTTFSQGAEASAHHLAQWRFDRHLDDPSPEHLAALRNAYLVVPEHLQLYLLGDQDAKDIPLRILLTHSRQRPA